VAFRDLIMVTVALARILDYRDPSYKRLPEDGSGGGSGGNPPGP
jgi:hypothetical protein